MSRSYRKQPFWSICGWCSSDKVFAARLVRSAHKRKLKEEFLKGDFENFLLPHKFECRFNDPWSWASDGKKSYNPKTRRYSWDWECYLAWRNISEEELRVMEVEDVLDGKFEISYPDFWYHPEGIPTSKTRSRADWENYHTWPTLAYKKMLRK